jgi:2-oxoglutarate dehydrogenase E1 component
VQECLNLSELPGYRVGGTLHVVLNNQIGFTTNPDEGRSCAYSTDVAKMLQIPIFHVNGEDPEAVAQCVKLGLDFRKEFQRDVVIDMYAYRLRGHNEGDDPSYTQPLLYKTIARQCSVRDGYLRRLLALKGVTAEEAASIEADARARLDKEFEKARSKDYQLSNPTAMGFWGDFHGGPAKNADGVVTAISADRVKTLLKTQTQIPEDFHLHPKLLRAMERRREMADGKRPLDWSAAEAVAIASLADEGFRVRISGQDTERGTFSQRHAVLHDYETGRKFMPLQHVSPNQGPVEVINSPLSEVAVLGYEYGYSLDWPEGLVAWEAQFGDFVNAAQVVIDQFIASAEAKWRRLSGVVLLLPHGFEGQGPEHSSARLERFLALAADDNLQVVSPTTPAQYFHCLRRQVLRKWRKPLIVMTPKSLLRHRECESGLDDFESGRFQLVIDDSEINTAKEVDRILFCSGKVYYDLLERQRELEGPVPPLIRLEQFYPLPVQELRDVLAKFGERTPVVWVQEEPENMGAWRFMRIHWDQFFSETPLSCVSRPASASPATGSKTAHDREQKHLIERALRRG